MRLPRREYTLLLRLLEANGAVVSNSELVPASGTVSATGAPPNALVQSVSRIRRLLKTHWSQEFAKRIEFVPNQGLVWRPPSGSEGIAPVGSVSWVTYHDVELNPRTLEFRAEDRTVRLQHKQYAVLASLLAADGSLVRYETLLSFLNSNASPVSGTVAPNTLVRFVFLLRQLLKEHWSEEFANRLEFVRNEGLVWNPPGRGHTLSPQELADFSIASGGVRLDPSGYRLYAAGTVIRLTPTTYDILETLVLADGAVVPYEEFLVGDSSTREGLWSSITRLRSVLRENWPDTLASRIVAVRGVGLYWNSPSVVDASKGFTRDKLTYLAGKNRLFFGQQDFFFESKGARVVVEKLLASAPKPVNEADLIRHLEDALGNSVSPDALVDYVRLANQLVGLTFQVNGLARAKIVLPAHVADLRQWRINPNAVVILR